MSLESATSIKSLNKKSLVLKNNLTFGLSTDSNSSKNDKDSILASLFEKIASMKDDEKILTYKMLNALLLTAIAKNTKNRKERRLVFNLKNNLLRSIIEIPHEKEKVNLRYLHSEKTPKLFRCKSCYQRHQKLLEKSESNTSISCDNCFTANREDVIEFSWDFDFGLITAFIEYRRIPFKIIKNLIEDKAPRTGVNEEINFLDHELVVSDLKGFDEISALSMYHVLKEKILAFKDDLSLNLVNRL